MTEHNLEVLAARRVELTHQRDLIDAAIADIDATILANTAPGDRLDIDGQPAWTVRAGNRRWNDDRARDALPQQLLDAITVTETRLSPKLAKDLLPPRLLAECTVEGKPFIARAKQA